MELLIPCAFGIEAVVKRQLGRLGYADAKAVNGRIALSGGWEDVAKLNINLASAERVLIKLKEFEARDFDALYGNVFDIAWQDIMPADARILTYAKSVDSKLFAVKSICSVVKKAIVDKLAGAYKTSLDESGARYMVELALFRDKATLCIDTSGDGLHKRGYRKLSAPAPLKETTAAALIDMSVFNPEKQFVDLFCGSGTIPIEACLRAIGKPPGIDRQFDYNFWPVDQTPDRLSRQEGMDKTDFGKKVSISGFDIDKNAVSISRYHAKTAGVENLIHFQAADMRSFSAKRRYGVMVSNPPYGERLATRGEVQKLYSDMGKLYASLPDWSFYIMTSFAGFERAFGRRAEKNRKIYNANIECRYYSLPGEKPPKKIDNSDAEC